MNLVISLVMNLVYLNLISSLNRCLQSNHPFKDTKDYDNKLEELKCLQSFLYHHNQ